MGEESTTTPRLYETPAHETPEGKERERAYFHALGRFVSMYANVESYIFMTLCLYANTPAKTARIIFSSTRIDQGSTLIKQLAKANNATQEKLDDLDYVLQQLGIINGVRNDLLHFGASFVAEGRPTISNALRAKGEPTETPISPDALDEMYDDLRKILVHLIAIHLGRPPQSASGKAWVAEVVQAPWRYKHPVTQKKRSKKGEGQPSERPGLESPPRFSP